MKRYAWLYTEQLYAINPTLTVSLVFAILLHLITFMYPCLFRTGFSILLQVIHDTWRNWDIKSGSHIQSVQTLNLS